MSIAEINAYSVINLLMLVQYATLIVLILYLNLVMMDKII
jgi:hypothetical protein